MDLQAYIASGVLELYAFDLLSDTDRREVEANIAKYPALLEELHQIEDALQQYVEAQGIPPSPTFKANLDARLGKEEPLSPATASVNKLSHKVNLWMLGLALFGLITAAGFWNYYHQQADSCNTLQDELNTLHNDCAETKAINRELQQQLQRLRETGNNIVQMRPTGIGVADDIAAVIYNPENKAAYLDVIKLSPPAIDHQYQLWAMVDGTPVDLGVFSIEVAADSTLLEVPFVEDAQAFAVTLEPRGGSISPSLAKMVVMGTL